MIIFRSVGPVISTRRFSRSSGTGATVHSPRRICSVSARKSGNLPASKSRCRCRRRRSNSSRRGANSRTSFSTNRKASSLRTSAPSSNAAARISNPAVCDETGLMACTSPKKVLVGNEPPTNSSPPRGRSQWANPAPAPQSSRGRTIRRDRSQRFHRRETGRGCHCWLVQQCRTWARHRTAGQASSGTREPLAPGPWPLVPTYTCRR